METTAIDGHRDIRVRSAVIRLETEEDVSTRQERGMQAADNVLKSLSPLINSMRLFGLYFSREPRVGPSATSQLSQESTRRCEGWTRSRIYATVMLVLIWINAVRYCMVFGDNKTLGVELLIKLSVLSNALLIVVLQTAYYVACHTGNLDRLFRRLTLSTSHLSKKYSRNVKLVTFVSWTLVAVNAAFVIIPIITDEQFIDPSMLILFKKLHLSKPYADIITVVFVAFELQYLAAYMFPQAINFMLCPLFMTVLFPFFFIICLSYMSFLKQ